MVPAQQMGGVWLQRNYCLLWPHIHLYVLRFDSVWDCSFASLNSMGSCKTAQRILNHSCSCMNLQKPYASPLSVASVSLLSVLSMDSLFTVCRLEWKIRCSFKACSFSDFFLCHFWTLKPSLVKEIIQGISCYEMIVVVFSRKMHSWNYISHRSWSTL